MQIFHRLFIFVHCDIVIEIKLIIKHLDFQRAWLFIQAFFEDVIKKTIIPRPRPMLYGI